MSKENASLSLALDRMVETHTEMNDGLKKLEARPSTGDEIDSFVEEIAHQEKPTKLSTSCAEIALATTGETAA